MMKSIDDILKETNEEFNNYESFIDEFKLFVANDEDKSPSYLITPDISRIISMYSDSHKHDGFGPNVDKIAIEEDIISAVIANENVRTICIEESDISIDDQISTYFHNDPVVIYDERLISDLGICVSNEKESLFNKHTHRTYTVSTIPRCIAIVIPITSMVYCDAGISLLKNVYDKYTNTMFDCYHINYNYKLINTNDIKILKFIKE